MDDFEKELEKELGTQTDFEQALAQELKQVDNSFEKDLAAELNLIEMNDRDNTITGVQAVMGGYDKKQVNPNTSKEIKALSRGVYLEEDIPEYLKDKDVNTIRLEADLPNLAKREKSVANFAGGSKENLDIVKNNYVKVQQTASKAKQIANGKAISNWEKLGALNAVPVINSANAAAFLYGTKSLEDFVATANETKRMAEENDLSGPAIDQVRAFWKSETTGFSDYTKMVYEDPETALAEFQRALSAASTVGASIIGGAAGAAAGGLAAGPVGAAKGATAGSVAVGSFAEFGGYVAEELSDPKYLDNKGNISIEKVRADKDFITRMRFEASAKGLATGLIETFLGKLAGAGSSKIVKYIKPESLSDISKIRKVTAGAVSAASKPAGEFIEEAGGSLVTETGMDAYKGRLTPKKFRQNITQAVEEGVSGAILGGTVAVAGKGLKTVKATTSDLLGRKAKAEQVYKESTQADSAKAFVKAVLEVQNQLDEMAITEDKAEELLSHAMKESQVSPDNSNTIESLSADGEVRVQLDMLEVEAALGESTNDFIESLPFEIQEEARKNLNEGGVTEIPANIFIARSMKYPAVVALGVHPQNDIHGHQAEEIHQRLEKEIEEVSAPKAEMARKSLEGEVIPNIVIAPMEGVTIQMRGQNSIVINNRGQEQTLDLYQEESAEEYAQVADTLVKGILDRIPDILNENPQFIPNLTAVATRVIIKRAKVLGVSAKDLTASLVINYTDPGAYVEYSMDGVSSLPANIRRQRYNIGSGGSTLTIFHEMAHYILNGMVEDKGYLMALPEPTQEQSDYLEVIKATEIFLGVDDIVKAIQFPSEEVSMKHPNPDYANKRKMNKSGEVVENQSGDALTVRTLTHEKFATTMEKFILQGELPSEAKEEFVKLFLYTKNFTAKGVEHLVSPETSNAAVEYTQAVGPNADVSKVFGTVYNIAEDFLTRITPLFNFPELPVQLLGAKGPEMLQKLSSVKYKLIAKEFIMFYYNQTKFRKEIERMSTDSLSDEDVRTAIITSESPAINGLLDLIELGLIGKIRRTDLKQKYMDRVSLRILDMISEPRSETRLEDYSIMSGDTDAELWTRINKEVSSIANSIAEGIKNLVMKSVPNLKTDKQIKEEFEKGIASALPTLLKKQLQVMVAEYPTQSRDFLKVMSKQSPQLRGAYGKMLKDKAIRSILKMPTRNITFARLKNSVNKANNAVINAFSTGRIEASLQFKEEEVLASYILNEGVKLRPKLERAIKNIRDFARARTQNIETGTAPEIINHIKFAIALIGEGKEVKPFIPMTEAKIQDAIAEALDVSPELDFQQVQKIIYDAVTIVSPETMSVITKEDVQDLNSMLQTLSEVSKADGPASVNATIYLDSTIKYGIHIAERVRQAELSVREGDRAEIIQDLTFALDKAKRKLNLRTKMPFQFRDIHSVFRTLYKTDEEYLASRIYKVLEDIINNEAKLTSMKADISQKLYDAFKDSFRSKENILLTILGKYVELDNESDYSKPIFSPNLKFTYKNKGELLTALLLSGSDSGRERLLLSNGLIDIDSPTEIRGDEKNLFADFDQLYSDGVITDADLRAINTVWQVMDTLYPMIKEVYRRQRGIMVGKVKASPFTVGGVEMVGGYYPVGYSQSNKLQTSADISSFKESFFELYRFMPSYMTKSRSDQVGKEPVDLSLNRISSYVDTALRTYFLEEGLDTFASVINNDQVTALLNEKRVGALEPSFTNRKGRTIERGIINGWISAVRNQTVIDTSDASSFQRFVAGNLPLTQYAVGVTSAVVNLTSGLVPALTEINPVSLGIESLRTLSTLGLTGVDPSAMSDYMKSREAQFMRFFIDSENSIEQVYTDYEVFRDKYVAPFSLYLMKFTQNNLEKIAWRAAYSQALKEGKTDSEAVRKADFVVRAVVTGYEASASSEGQRGGYYQKLVNMAALHLYSGRRQLFAAYNREGARVTRNISAFAVGLTLAGLGGSVDLIVRSAMTPSAKLYEPPEEEQEKIEMGVLSATFGYFGGPYVRGFDIFSNFATPSVNPLASAVSSVYKGGKAVMEGALWAPYPMTAAQKRGVQTGASLMTGYPFTSISKAENILDLLKTKGELYSEEKVEGALRGAYKKVEKWE